MPFANYDGIRTLAGICLGKLVLMPLCTFIFLVMYREVLPKNNVLLLIMMLESVTPSGTNNVIICSMHGHGAQIMSTILFWEYMFGIVSIGCWVSMFLFYIAW